MLVPVTATIRPEQFLRTVRNRLDELGQVGLTHHSMLADRSQLHAIEDLHMATRKMLPSGIWMEQYLHPVQVWLVLPMFAFFNAGVALSPESLSQKTSFVSLGVIVGLFFGKQIGVTGWSLGGHQ